MLLIFLPPWFSKLDIMSKFFIKLSGLASFGVCLTLTETFADGDAFLIRIVTCHVCPSLQFWVEKSQYGEAEKKAAPVKVTTWLSVGKDFANWRESLLINFLHKRCPISTSYYCELLDRVKSAFWAREDANQFEISFSCMATLDSLTATLSSKLIDLQ